MVVWGCWFGSLRIQFFNEPRIRGRWVGGEQGQMRPSTKIKWNIFRASCLEPWQHETVLCADAPVGLQANPKGVCLHLDAMLLRSIIQQNICCKDAQTTISDTASKCLFFALFLVFFWRCLCVFPRGGGFLRACCCGLLRFALSGHNVLSPIGFKRCAWCFLIDATAKTYECWIRRENAFAMAATFRTMAECRACHPDDALKIKIDDFLPCAEICGKKSSITISECVAPSLEHSC